MPRRFAASGVSVTFVSSDSFTRLSTFAGGAAADFAPSPFDVQAWFKMAAAIASRGDT